MNNMAQSLPLPSNKKQDMWYQIKSFIQFYWKSITKYNVQSPFLYDFVTNVLDTEKEYYGFQMIENQRKILKSSSDSIVVTDFGAGSKSLDKNRRKVSKIAHTSISGETKCRVLFNLALHYKAKNILELGTSLGISSSYLACYDSNAKIVSLEGDLGIANIAKKVHQNLNLKNVEVIIGPFHETLSKALSLLKKVDVAFIDGHHALTPTLQYFEEILPFCHNESILVIDDIYWSTDMQTAWKTLIDRPEVSLTIDLYDIGIIFFKKELTKNNVSYVSYKYKPWKIGLFG